MRIRRDHRTAVQFLLFGCAVCRLNGTWFKKGNKSSTYGARHLEPGCCASDTAFATNCAYSVLRIRLALVPEWFASTKRMKMGIG